MTTQTLNTSMILQSWLGHAADLMVKKQATQKNEIHNLSDALRKDIGLPSNTRQQPLPRVLTERLW